MQTQHFTTRVAAFSSEGVRYNKISVEDGIVQVWDSVCRGYTACHALDSDDIAFLLKKALGLRISAMQEEEFITAMNSGTFGPQDCMRAIRTGNTKAGEYEIYEKVGSGERRFVGCDPKIAPGVARVFRDDIDARRAELRALRQEYRAM